MKRAAAMMLGKRKPLFCFGFLLSMFVACMSPHILVAAPAAQPESGPTVVIIKQMHFDPHDITVRVGGTVEWKNEDIFTHTVTANDGSFDSGPIAPGTSWKTTLTRAGQIAYHCRPHPNMTAQLTVKGAGAEANTSGAGAPGKPENAGSLKWAPPTMPQEIHPILVNFTAALLPLALLSDLLGRIFKRQSLHNAAFWIIVYAACITPFTAAAGWWWRHSLGANLPAKLITVHEWLGTAAVFIFIGLGLWRWSIHKRGVPPTFAYLFCALLAVLALVYQGSLGGAMVFGR